MKLPDVNNDLNTDKENADITVPWKPDEKLDQAVVFNSKRSKVPIILEKHNRKTLLPNSSTESLQRNVINVNYGSPNLTAGNNMHKREKSSSFSGSRPKRKIKTDRNDPSDTVSVHKVVIKQKEKTMNENSGNISKTQAFHKNIICQAAILSRDVNAKRTTMIDASRNTLMTDKASVKLENRGATLRELGNKSMPHAVSYNKKHKTTDYDYDTDQDNLLNAQIVSSNKKGSIRKPADNDKDKIYMTQILSSNVLDETANKSNTMVSNDEAAPANRMLSDKQTKEKCRTLHKNDERKITVSKAFHVNVILLNNETNFKGKQTVLHKDNVRNISMMQASENNKDNNEAKSIPASINNTIEMSKPKRIFYETGTGNITIKQTTQQLKVTPENSDEKPIADFKTSLKLRNKKTTTIVYDNDVGGASISGNKIKEARIERKTYDDDETNISLSLAVTVNNYKLDLIADIKKPEPIKDVKPEVIDDDIMKEAIDEIKLIDCDEFENLKDKGDVSVNGAIAAETKSLAYDDDINLTISTNIYLLNNLDSAANMSKPGETSQDNSKSTVFKANYLTPKTSLPTIQIFPDTDKNKTVMRDNDKCGYCNISVGQPIPAELISVETEFCKPASPQSNITVLQASTKNSSQASAYTREHIYSKESFCRDPPIVSVKKTNEPKVSLPVVSSSIIPTSAIAKLVNPKDIGKLQVKQISSTTDPNIDKVCDGDEDAKIQIHVEEKSGLQSNLLDRSIDRGNKSLIAIVESDPTFAAIPQDPADECMFYVMKDSDDATRTDRRLDSAKQEHVVHFQRKMAELKKVMAMANIDIPSRSLKEDKRDEHDDMEQQNYSQSIADVTRELLSVISNITGNFPCEDDGQPVVLKDENQGEAIKLKRPSPAPNTCSNISEAQAVLQKTSDNDCADEDTRDTSRDISEKSDRTSHKVDNTKFSDEWIDVTTFKYEEKYAPLNKTGFNETSYLIDGTKEKVVPTYLSDVSEGIKELMIDLVKPVSDNIMVENELIDNENTSMHSAQIQANLDASSHIDKTRMPKVSPVLIFDYHNPLHNILLAPPDLSDAHRYNPRKSYTTHCDSRCYEEETCTSRKQEKICVCQKINHFTTYPYSSKKRKVKRVDQSVDAVSTHVTHDEANTIIAMKRNEELLQASSSHTIIEDVTKSINRALTSDNSTHSNYWISFYSQADTEEQYRCVNRSHSRESATFSNKHIYNHATDKNKQYSASTEMIPEIQKSPYTSLHKASTELSSNDSTHNMGPVKEKITKNASTKVAENKSSRNKLTYIYFVEQSAQPGALIFDHRIPVINIQHTPNNFSDAHKYDPRKTEETVCSSTSSFYKMSKGDYEVDKALSSKQYTMEPETDAVQQDNASNEPNTVNKLDDKDDEVNPGDMEGNKEFLGASLSFTVGEGSKGENISKNSKQLDLKRESSRSPLFTIEDQTAKIDINAKILGNSSGDQFSSLNYGPFMESLKQYAPPMEVTSVTKMQNATMSDKVTTKLISMDDFTHNHILEKDATETNNETAQLSTICEKKSPGSKETPILVEQPHPVVLVFDLKNPLNNIRLAPTNMMDAHKYEPRQTGDSLCDNGNQLMNEVHISMTTLYVRMPQPSTKQNDMTIYKKADQFILQSTKRRSICAEQSLDDNLTQESEGNATITMRGNKKLIESISSLTLVVDELESKNRVSTSNVNLKRGNKVTRSLLGYKKKQASKTANQRKEERSAKLQEISSRDPFHSNLSEKRDKKRILLPNKSKQRSLSVKMTKRSMVADKKMLKYNHCRGKHIQYPPPITLKPGRIIQNVTNLHEVTDESLSTKTCTPNIAPKDVTESINQNATKISSKNKVTKPGKINTVQPLLTDYHNIEIDHQHNNDSDDMIDDLTKKHESLSALSEASFTSSNNMRDDNGHHQISKQDLALLDWHAEPSDYDSEADVIAKINELPLMGTTECEWESLKSPSDTWSFKLLQGRLRLTTRLALYDSGISTQVRGDTAVLDIAVETLQHDYKNTVMTLCVHFAHETMRYIVSHALREHCCASVIPPLLQRCTAVARVALRWARAMHDAKSQLSYTLDNNGNISMKVENVQLRSNWEVTMHIELVLQDYWSVPWPKAGGVHVTHLVSKQMVPDTHVRRALSDIPWDWEHVPKTVWRMFDVFNSTSPSCPTSELYKLSKK